MRWDSTAGLRITAATGSAHDEPLVPAPNDPYVAELQAFLAGEPTLATIADGKRVRRRGSQRRANRRLPGGRSRCDHRGRRAGADGLDASARQGARRSRRPTRRATRAGARRRDRRCRRGRAGDSRRRRKTIRSTRRPVPIGVRVVRGDATDVLDRYHAAARWRRPMRSCASPPIVPLLDPVDRRRAWSNAFPPAAPTTPPTFIRRRSPTATTLKC